MQVSLFHVAPTGLEADLEAEVELADEVAGSGSWEEVVAAEGAVLHVVGELVPDRDADRVPQADQSPVAGGDIGARGAAGGDRGLAEHAL